MPYVILRKLKIENKIFHNIYHVLFVYLNEKKIRFSLKEKKKSQLLFVLNEILG